MPKDQKARGDIRPAGDADQAGSTVVVVHTERQMKFYLVYDDELTNMSDTNDRSKAFMSIGLSLGSFTIGLILQPLAFMDVPWEKISPLSKFVCALGGPVLIVLAIVFLCFGLKERSKFRGQRNKIVGDSRARDVKFSASMKASGD